MRNKYNIGQSVCWYEYEYGIDYGHTGRIQSIEGGLYMIKEEIGRIMTMEEDRIFLNWKDAQKNLELRKKQLISELTGNVLEN